MSGKACKWCGSRQQGDYGHVFACESYESVAGAVVQSYQCQRRCLDLRLQHEQTIEILKAREANTVEALRGHIEQLEKRVADALAALNSITRYNIETDDEGFFIDASERNDLIESEDPNAVLDILTGSKPEQESEQ